MLRVGLKLILPLALLAVSATSPVKAQVFAYGWAGYAFPQFGYAYGCPPVYYEPYCSSYADPCALPGFWAGYTLPYFYGGAYSPYRPRYYGYGSRFYYGGGLRYPLYRGAAPAFRGYGRGYLGYRGIAGAGYRAGFYGGRSRFGAGGFRGGGFRGGRR